MGLLCQTVGLVWIALGAGGSYPALIPGMVLVGVGVSAAMPAAQNAAIGAVRQEAIGTASGVYNAMRQVGGAFGIAIAQAVFAAAGSFASPATGLTRGQGLQGAMSRWHTSSWAARKSIRCLRRCARS